MGLDLVLGGLVLVTAIRGWLKGFVLQAVRLAGLVACVYLADPVRDQFRPYVLSYLPKIRPDLVDRLLWWSSAVASYVVLVGLATLTVTLYRRQPIGLAEPKPVQAAAGQTPRLAIPSEPEEESAALQAPGLDNEIARAIESIKRQLQQDKVPE